MVDLVNARNRVMEEWATQNDPLVPLPLAAAYAVHRAYANTNALVPKLEYEQALNFAAAALSRFMPVFHVDATGRPSIAPASVTSGKFRHGARTFVSNNGERLGPLLVPRQDVHEASSIIVRAGLPLQFTLARREDNQRARA